MATSFKVLALGCLVALSLPLLMLTEVRPAATQPIATRIFAITVGHGVPVGELEAVGMLNGGSCTAALISPNLVLTAAHCVCPANWKSVGCDGRANFTLDNVFPIDDPATTIDESHTRRDITLAGTVRVHPEYEQWGWQHEDIAIVTLDRSVAQVAPSVAPITVEAPYNTPLKGDPLTLVGYGVTGKTCSNPPAGKRRLELNASVSNQGSITFEYEGSGACFGDSGGPLLNRAGHIVGVASWISVTQDSSGAITSVDASIYRPTSSSYNWIFGIPSPTWSSLTWVSVENAGINSHAPYSWCFNGSFLVSFDLDGNRDLSPYDSPIVGQAQCATLASPQAARWGTCSWEKVEQRGMNSHAPLPAWCPLGSYLVGFDLDGPRDISDKDAPVIGQVRCCTLAGMNQSNWGSSYWVEVGAIASHNFGQPWCLNGAFLTQFDLDQFDAKVHPDAYDAPIVGQAKCSRPLP